MTVHGEIHQSHGTLRTYGESMMENKIRINFFSKNKIIES